MAPLQLWLQCNYTCVWLDKISAVKKVSSALVSLYFPPGLLGPFSATYNWNFYDFINWTLWPAGICMHIRLRAGEQTGPMTETVEGCTSLNLTWRVQIKWQNIAVFLKHPTGGTRDGQKSQYGEKGKKWEKWRVMRGGVKQLCEHKLAKRGEKNQPISLHLKSKLTMPEFILSLGNRRGSYLWWLVKNSPVGFFFFLGVAANFSCDVWRKPSNVDVRSFVISRDLKCNYAGKKWLNKWHVIS